MCCPILPTLGPTQVSLYAGGMVDRFASVLLPVAPSDPMYGLYNAAKSIDITSSFIRLPAGVEWPLLGSIPLYVRDCYVGCFEGVLQSFDGLDFLDGRIARKFIVCGNPGISKSAFGL